MANGGTLAELVDNGRGRWTVLTAVVLTLASGVSWWISTEGREYTDARIDFAIAQRNAISDIRYQTILADLARLEREAAQTQHAQSEEFRRVWAEMARRVDREFLDAQQGEHQRRLDVYERRLERIEQRRRIPDNIE